MICEMYAGWGIEDYVFDVDTMLNVFSRNIIQVSIVNDLKQWPYAL